MPEPNQVQQAHAGADGGRLPERSGALVQSVVQGSPAEKAGLRRGDLVIEADEQPVKDPQALLEQVEASTLGEALNLKVLRQGREQDLAVKPAALPGMS